MPASQSRTQRLIQERFSNRSYQPIIGKSSGQTIGANMPASARVNPQLEKYKGIDGSYDIGAFLQDNPNVGSVEILRQSGFGEDTLTKANEYLDAYKSNQAYKADIAAFESKINEPGYPYELKKAYEKAKEAENYDIFNEAVDKYNSNIAAERTKFEQQSKAFGELAISIATYNRDHPTGDPKPLTAEDQAAIDTYMKSPTGDAKAKLEKYFEDKNKLIPVGSKLLFPEHISKADYDKIAAADEANGTNFLETLKKDGFAGYNARVLQFNERNQGNKDAWIRDYIKKDTYLNSILINEGEAAALKAWEKRQEELEKITERWIEKNIKTDSYLNSVLTDKGQQAAVEAWSKRQSELSAINLRKFEKWIANEAPERLRTAYQQGGVDAYRNELSLYLIDYQKAFEAVKPYIEKEVKTTTIKAKDSISVSGQTTIEKDATLSIGQEESIDAVQYLRDKKDEKYLEILGVSKEDIKAAKNYIIATTPHDQFVLEYFKERGWDTTLPVSFETYTPGNKERIEFEKHLQEADGVYYAIRPEAEPRAILKEMVLGMIPIYGTVRYASQASKDGLTSKEAGWIALSALTDVFTLVPIIGQLSAAARGTFMAGKAGQFISTGVKLRQLGKAAGYIAVSEVTAPLRALAHPIETLKSGLYSIETLVRGRKLPLSALETKWNTMRIPIESVGGDVKTAKQLRDDVTEAMVMGRSNTAEVNGWKVELNPAAVNRLGKPVVISATPDIRPFMDGAVVGKGKPVLLESGQTVIMGEGRNMYLAPTLHTRFSEATSTGLLPKDPIKGGLIIRDEAIIKQLESSGKTYAGTTEIETTLRAEKDISLGTPVQYLVTRSVTGEKLVLAVFGKPFTPTEIARLKFMGSVDTVKQIFQTPVKVGRAGEALRGYDDLATLVEEKTTIEKRIASLKRTGKVSEAAKLEDKLTALEKEINETYSRTSKVLSNQYRLPLRTVVVNTNDESPLDRYRYATGDNRRTVTFTSSRNSIKSVPRRPVTVVQSKRIPANISGREDETPPRGKKENTPRGREELDPRRGTNNPRGIVEKPPRGYEGVEPKTRKGVITSPRAPTNPPRPSAPDTPPRIPPSITPPPEPPTLPPFTPKYPKNRSLSDREKRRVIAESGGAIAWKQGTVTKQGGGRQDRWDAIVNPYSSNEQYIMVLGKPPRGATIVKRGPRSAYATAQMLYGQPPKRQIRVDSGLEDVTVTAEGRKINVRFTPDPHGKTTGDITIGQRQRNISEPVKPISAPLKPIDNKNTRISPAKKAISIKQRRLE